MTEPVYYYRMDHWYDGYGSVTLMFDQFRVLKTTLKGVWISTPYQNKKGKKFILNDARKRYAYPTKELALNSMIIRKSRYISIMRSKIEETEAVLNAAKEMVGKDLSALERFEGGYLDWL